MKQNKNVISNLIWRFAERCGAQLVTFIVSVVLARILAPEDYGQIALITVFTTIMQVFVDSGLGTALIQKKDADDIDFVNAMLNIKKRKEERTLKSLKASALYNEVYKLYNDKKMAQVALMLANAGYTFDMAAASIGCSVADIKNPNNWNGAIFYFNNKAYEFRFSYNDSGEINTSTFIIR